jgi:predicted nuclease of predicted toxin-antitoxin system
MRFLCDMGVSLRVVEWLKGGGHDVVHLRDEGLHRMANGAIFQKALAERRIVLTFDLDFGEILSAVADQLVSVVLFRLHNTRTPHVIERLAAVLEQSSQDLAAGCIVVVEEGRHRVRKLPVGS